MALPSGVGRRVATANLTTGYVGRSSRRESTVRSSDAAATRAMAIGDAAGRRERVAI